MKVWIIQHLCPERHCLMAAVFDESTPHEKALANLKAGEKKMGLNAKCGICGSTELFYEVRPTKFKSLEEAMPHVQLEAIKQEFTRHVIDGQKARSN